MKPSKEFEELKNKYGTKNLKSAADIILNLMAMSGDKRSIILQLFSEYCETVHEFIDSNITVLNDTQLDATVNYFKYSNEQLKMFIENLKEEK